MFRASIVLIALIGASAAFRVVFDQTLNSHWELYKTKHGKTYNTDEDQQRRIIWEETVKFINQHNLKADLGLTSYRMGLNKFTDMTNDEFRAYKGLRFNATALRGKAHTNTVLPSVGAPASVDWRDKGYVTPVKDQGQCGSCWAFSATGSLEGQHFHATGKLVSLSEQNLVDCSGSFGNMGCMGGLMDQAFDYIKANKGIDTEASYPYTAQDGQCKYNTNGRGAGVTGFHDVASEDESDLQNAVATIGPVSVAIDAGHASFQSYSSGVYDEPECSPTMLDHGVLAVGYGTSAEGKDFWIVKNSWGEVWGTKGYILMSRNKNNQCGIATKASYPLV